MLTNTQALAGLSALLTKKPHYTAAQVVAHQKEGWKQEYSRVVSPAMQILELIVPCETCEGTGKYVNAKYTRPCFRCLGKGHQDADDVKRNAVYDRSTKRTTTYQSYA